LTKWLTTVALVGFFAAGALLQEWAMKQEALGPSYVVVLGLEALLAVIAGNVIFNEPISAKLFGGIFLVIAGITLLRLK
jgi:multidrug transporter EmrE-like cation transporter